VTLWIDNQRASDPEIFAAARAANVVVITKDADFIDLLEKSGPHPAVVLVKAPSRRDWANFLLPLFP
jgi:predicted nuclease of predicted toxin-antitoxin system